MLRTSEKKTPSQHWPATAEVFESKGQEVRAGARLADGLLTFDKELLDKISTILKQQNPPVTDLQAASQGFENFGHFVAAVHVSHNLGIPFGQLKTHMQTSGNLGKANNSHKPDAHANAEANSAAKQSAGAVNMSEPKS